MGEDAAGVLQNLEKACVPPVLPFQVANSTGHFLLSRSRTPERISWSSALEGACGPAALARYDELQLIAPEEPAAA